MKLNANELSKNTILSFSGKIYYSAASLLVVILFARTIDVDVYGQFIYIYTALYFLIPLVKMGLDVGVVAFIPKYKVKGEEEKIARLIWFCFCAIAVAGVFIVSLVMFFSEYISLYLLKGSYYSALLQQLSPLVVVIALNMVLYSLLRALGLMFESVIAECVILPTTQLVLVFALSFLDGSSVKLLLMCFYCGFAFSVFYSIFILYKKSLIKAGRMKVDNNRIIIYSIPLMFDGFFAMLIAKLDVVMIGALTEPKNVAFYNVAVQIATFIVLLLIAVNSAIGPMISKFYHEGNISKIENIYKDSTKWVCVFGFAIYGCVVLGARPLLELFGDDYSYGIWALTLVASGQMINLSVGSVGWIHSMTGRPKYNMYVAMITLSLNVILNIFFIPIWGINGAALATLISFLVSNMVALALVKKELGIHPYSSGYFRVALVFIISILIVLFMSFLSASFQYKEVVSMCVFVCLYTVLLLKYGLNAKDKSVIKSIVLTNLTLKKA